MFLLRQNVQKTVHTKMGKKQTDEAPLHIELKKDEELQ